MDSVSIVNVLRTRRKEKGSLTAQEQTRLESAINTLPEDAVWQAWQGECLAGKGQTESDAIEDAIKEFHRNKDLGVYPDNVTDDVFRESLDTLVCNAE